MGKLIAIATSALGAITAAVSMGGCLLLYIDEPEMPKTLIK